MAKRKERQEYSRIRGDSGQHRRILWVMAVLGLAAFVPIACQLYYLMITNFEYYRNLALRNQTRTTYVTADRGTIYDRNMNIMAISQGTENVYLDPHELKQSKADMELVGRGLGEILHEDPEWIRSQGADLKKRYKQVGTQISREDGAKIRKFINDNHISGIHLEPNSKRAYPYGTLASQIIGFTNASNTGCEGVEAAYNRYLEGIPGKVITTKGNNEMDMPYSYEKYVESIPGCDIILTIDTTVQACLEKQMRAAIAKYDVQNGAFGIVMSVKTGQILAMANLDGYDPNQYLEIGNPMVKQELEQMKLAAMTNPQGSDAYKTGLAAYEKALTEARLKQWRNRCISDGYEPGSTFKVLTMAAALDCGAIDLNTNFYCRGSEHIPGRSQLLHCWRHQGHGAEKTPQALQNSCNIAFAHIALKLGGERFYDYVQRFGIMEKTGIDLAGESKGVFFSKDLIVNTDKWGTASLTSGSFGQTFKLTPMQLVRAIASVVNGGNLLEPYLVSEAVDAEGKTVLKQEPTVIRQTINPETSKTMCSLLESVVTEGTAKNAAVAGFSIGGKTGTSEKIDVLDENGRPTLDKIVSFVGVAPMDDPEYIVLVALDTPSRTTGIHISGGVMAAPTVGAVMGDILPYLAVKQNFTPEDAAGQIVVVEDLHGMTAKEAEKLLKDKGLKYKITGDGETITGQIPAAGTGVPGNSEILLYLGEMPPEQETEVPDFVGMNREQAEETAENLGLFLQIAGNPEKNQRVTVTEQSIPAGTKVSEGTTVRLQFADTEAAD